MFLRRVGTVTEMKCLKSGAPHSEFDGNFMMFMTGAEERLAGCRQNDFGIIIC